MDTESAVDEHDPKAPWRDEPGLGRSIVIGSILAGIASFVGVTGATLLSGMEWSSAVSLGLFVAFWGGVGFGSMMGGVMWATRSERLLEAEARSGRTAKTEGRSEPVEPNEQLVDALPQDHPTAPERIAS